MGRFTIRLPDTLHQELERQAQHEGVSLNQYVVYALTQKVTPSYLIQVQPDADIERQQQRIQALLKKLGEPDRTIASEYLATREVETDVDPGTAALLARVEAKLAKNVTAQVRGTGQG